MNEIQIKKLEKGIQMGYRCLKDLPDDKLFISTGIQKYQGKYVVYIGNVLDSKIMQDDFEREIFRVFTDLEQALQFIEKEVGIKRGELHALKGQRIFTASHAF